MRLPFVAGSHEVAQNERREPISPFNEPKSSQATFSFLLYYYSLLDNLSILNIALNLLTFKRTETESKKEIVAW